LIGAAHAGCFTMALSNIMSEAGHVPESISTTAKVHLRQVDGVPTISEINLETEGRVPGIDQQQFADFAAKAKEGCVVSRALAGVPEITLEATLAG
jgi:osmotically inducible protein OsmC